MATIENTTRTGYTNEYGKPIGNNIDKWFEHGIKPTEEPVEGGIYSTKQTLYVLLFVIGFIFLAIIIIVPISIGIASKH